jgi:hypothetical protein
MFAWGCGSAEQQTEAEEAVTTEAEGPAIERKGIRISPLQGSPAFSEASLRLEGDPAQEGNSWTFNYGVENYELGAQTPTAGENGLANSANGQHIHFILDNGPYSAHYEPVVEKEIDEGHHVILAFLSRSYHESVKNGNSFVITELNPEGSGPADGFDASQPTLFYSRPKGTYTGADAQKVLLDFFLLNCDLSDDGYKVRATINGEADFLLTTWQPYVMEGLPMGENTIKLELLDAEGNSVPGPFNTVERTVTLEEAAQ